MYDRAMDKLRDEMAQEKSSAVKMAGELITLYLMADPANAEKILADGNTIKGAYSAMREYARKNRCECIPPDEACDIFAEYYGFSKLSFDEIWSAAQSGQKGKPQAPAKPESDDLDLDALLGL